MNNSMNGQYNNQPVGSLTIIRPKNFLGCAIAYDVFVDGHLIGQVKNGESKQFPLYYGNHLVELKHGFNEGSQQIIINDAQRNLVFQCPMKMGLLKNKILFNFVQFYN